MCYVDLFDQVCQYREVSTHDGRFGSRGDFRPDEQLWTRHCSSSM